MSEILKPCPFCGSDKVDGIFIRDGWSIGCRDCGAGVRAYHPNAHTVSADKWNRRSDSDLTEERDRLREALKAIIREDDTGPMAYELREDGPSQAIGGTEGRFAAIARAALSPPTAEGREP